MARRRPSHAPAKHPALVKGYTVRTVLASRDTADVWSEQDPAGGIVVHTPGLDLRAPARPPTDARRAAERMRGMYLFAGEADAEDLEIVLATAFGDQPVARLPRAQQLVAAAHVLKLWGVSLPWH